MEELKKTADFYEPEFEPTQKHNFRDLSEYETAGFSGLLVCM
jgi:hypothetical protein